MAKVKSEPAPDPLSVGRHNGERIWGYEVFPDGSVRLSPNHADRMRTILDTEAGLHAMQEGVARFVAAEFARTAERRRKWWGDLRHDLGFGNNDLWTFDSTDGVVRPTPKKVDEPNAR